MYALIIFKCTSIITEENSDFWCVLISVDDDPKGEKDAEKKAEKPDKK